MCAPLLGDRRGLRIDHEELARRRCPTPQAALASAADRTGRSSFRSAVNRRYSRSRRCYRLVTRDAAGRLGVASVAQR